MKKNSRLFTRGEENMFKENLIKLRKQMGLSQEELAEKVDVSRQTIYKWETGQNYPEMDRLVMLSELFNCSIDDLIKSEIDVSNLKDKEKYDVFYNKFAKLIAFSVSLILIGVSVMLLLFDVFGEDRYLVPLISLILFISISIMIFIIMGVENKEMKKKDFQKANFYSNEEKENFIKKFSIGISVGVVLILLAVIVLLVLYEFIEDHFLWPTALMIFIISIAIYLFIYFGIMDSKYKMKFTTQQLNYSKEPIILKDGENTITIYKGRNNSENHIASKISSIIMMLATIAFFILGFIFDAWHPGWIVFPIGGILTGIVSIIFPYHNS